ncbi:MAG: cation diffusion facilitator family transporter [Parvularculaceae bacterium]
MNHSGHTHGLRDDARRLTAALVVIAAFMVIETIGGILAGSLALLADAAHMLTDALALALAVCAHWLSSRPADRGLHFGYRRWQVLAAFLNGLALSGLLVWIVFEGVRRLLNPIEVEWRVMLFIAMLGLAANIFAFLILNGARTKNLNVRGALLHVVSDLLGSVAAVIAALVIAATAWSRIDPILSFVVAGLIARSAYRLTREAGHILLEGAPRDLNVEALIQGLKETAPVIRNVHQVRIWQLTPEHPSLTMHVCVDRADAAVDALQKAKTYLDQRYGIKQSTIQVEVGGACPDCADGGGGVAEAIDAAGMERRTGPARGPDSGAKAAFAAPTK